MKMQRARVFMISNSGIADFDILGQSLRVAVHVNSRSIEVTDYIGEQTKVVFVGGLENCQVVLYTE